MGVPAIRRVISTGFAIYRCPRTGESDLKGIFLSRNGGEKR
jgi:hypothetical protein